MIWHSIPLPPQPVNVALVGLPGSGKSTVGRQLARRLALPFLDSDAVIEARLGCSIREFFEREGEARFRDLEAQVLDELTAGPAGVISTGGGSVLRPENRTHLHTLFVHNLQALTAPGALLSQAKLNMVTSKVLEA